MNPLYNGWIRRHRRSDRESRKPAPWRANPPVSDELWARVEDVRRAKTRGGGAKRHDRVDLLGRPPRVRLRPAASATTARSATAATASSTSTRARPGAARPASPTRCGRGRCWRRSPASRSTTTRSRRWSRSSGRARRPVEMDRARIDRQIRELALEHAAGGLGRRGLPRPARRRSARQRDAIVERTGAGRTRRSARSSGCAPSPSRSSPADVPKEKADLMHAIYERITVAGPEIVGCPAHAGGLRARIGAGAARKGCNGAPDRIRTCDLRLRRPTLYPLSYRRASPDHTVRAWVKLRLPVSRCVRWLFRVQSAHLMSRRAQNQAEFIPDDLLLLMTACGDD